MTYTFPDITRGTPEYDEVVRILKRHHPGLLVEDESVHQINRRWLKGSVFCMDEKGRPIIADDRVTLVRKRLRIRIPKGSFLARATR